MKILFDDIIYSLQNSGGISVYWFELSSRLSLQSGVKFLHVEFTKNKNIFRNGSNVYARKSFYDIFNFGYVFKRYRYINVSTDHIDGLCHSSYYRTINQRLKKSYNIKEVVTVHDFIYERYSNGLKKWIHIFQKLRAIQSADVVICISENTKKDLLHFYPQFLNKDIRVVYNGVSNDYNFEGKFEEFEVDPPYLFFVGSRSAYKNFEFVVNSISNCKNSFFLKIVGSPLTLSERKILESRIPGRWRVYPYLSNGDLNEMYNKAYALIYPSSYEGFGIPIVEAMKAGCPFIALRGSSISEIAGEAGFLMSTLSMDEFSKGIDFIKDNREEIILKGLSRSKDFSWDKCFDATLKIYKELDSKINL